MTVAAPSFRENDNPLFGIKPKEEAEPLYQKILNLAPSPIGYGRGLYHKGKDWH